MGVIIHFQSESNEPSCPHRCPACCSRSRHKASRALQCCKSSFERPLHSWRSLARHADRPRQLLINLGTIDRTVEHGQRIRIPASLKSRAQRADAGTNSAQMLTPVLNVDQPRDPAINSLANNPGLTCWPELRSAPTLPALKWADRHVPRCQSAATQAHCQTRMKTMRHFASTPSFMKISAAYGNLQAMRAIVQKPAVVQRNPCMGNST